MSSKNIQNSSTLNQNKEKDNNKNNNSNNNININSFSNDFNKCFNKYKYSKKTNDNNDDINNKNITTSNKNSNSNQLNINSFAEFEFFYNDSQKKNNNIKQNTKLNKTNSTKTKENIFKKGRKPQNNHTVSNNKINNKLKNNDFNSPMNKVLSIKTQLYDNKFKERKPSQKKIKKNFSEKNFEIFLQNVKEYQKKKETKINNIRSKSLEKENDEIKKHPIISKNSLLLIKNNKRQPLYQKRPLNEEKNLDKNFNSFYSKNFYENSENANMMVKSPLNNKTIDAKFSKFYQDNLNWKKKIQDKNDNKRSNKNQIYEEYIGNYSFRPELNKNSINIVDKMNRNRSINYDINDNIYDNETEKELIDKLKVKLKPIISYYYNNKPYVNKRTVYLQRSKSDNNMRKNIYHNYNYKTNQSIKNKNYKINYKMNEKKYKKAKKEGKKEEKIEKKGKINKKELEKKERDFYLIIKIKELKKEKDNKKKELYKLNVRQGTAWNEEVINNIIPKQKCGHIIEGLL